MRMPRTFVAAVFLCTLAFLPAYPATVFTASLHGGIYNPPSGSSATGFGTVVLDGNSIQATLFAFGLSSAPVLSGIFGPGDINTGVPLFLPITMSSNGGSNYQGNAFTLVEQAFIDGLFAGQYLFNIFTDGGSSLVAGDLGFTAFDVGDLYSGGEIGGYLFADVPEPGSIVLAGLGVLAMTLGILLKRRA